MLLSIFHGKIHDFNHQFQVRQLLVITRFVKRSPAPKICSTEFDPFPRSSDSEAERLRPISCAYEYGVPQASGQFYHGDGPYSGGVWNAERALDERNGMILEKISSKSDRSNRSWRCWVDHGLCWYLLILHCSFAGPRSLYQGEGEKVMFLGSWLWFSIDFAMPYPFFF